jgi:uncharacterized protein (DUF302 family)
MKKKSRFPVFVLGVVMGVVLAGAAGWFVMPSLMLRERVSPLGLDETVARIEANAKADGWVVSGVRKLDDSVRKHGGGEVIPVRLVEMCQPHHAARILSDGESRKASVLMPCSIAVYRDEEEKVHVVNMNAGLMGRMFGGVISEVMGGSVAGEQEKILGFLDE